MPAKEPRQRQVAHVAESRAFDLETGGPLNEVFDGSFFSSLFHRIFIRAIAFIVNVAADERHDDPLGRGDRGPIPLHLILETTRSLSFEPGAPKRWEIELSILGDMRF